MENIKKLSLSEAVKRNMRAWKIWWTLCPGVFISMTLSSLFTALSPFVTIWISARIINELAGARNPQVLVKLVIIELVLAALLTLIRGALNRYDTYERTAASRIDDRIYMNKMFQMDFVNVDSQHTYDLYSQAMQNQQWSGWGIYRTLSIFEGLITAILQIAGGFALSLGLYLAKVPETGNGFEVLNNPLFAIGIIAVMLMVAILSPICENKGSEYWSRYAEEARFGNRFFSFFGFMSEDRKRAVDIRMYNQQENVCSIYMSKGDSFGPKSSIAKWAKGPMGLWIALSQSMSMILTGIVYLFVCLKAWAGAFGVGMVTQYVGAINNIFSGISRLLQNMGTMRINGDFLETSYEFLDIKNTMYQGSLTTEKRADRQYEVEFKDVSFKYQGTDTYALRHVNMKFKVGSRLAVVGMNGSGKTTFIKLLCRLYDPDEGEILLNGIDIRKYNYDDYINIFSVVFQDFELQSLPLGENIAGTVKYDRERVMECIDKAGFTERMNAMPKGLDTYLYKHLDKEGIDVSGGEAQKIAIARALHKDAPFIILDEPTAALDPIAEAEIYSKFNEIAGDKTAIYISHRLSSCKFCDEIAVFHEGQVIQQGTHDALVADEHGKYYELWNAQAQYYVEKSA